MQLISGFKLFKKTTAVAALISFALGIGGVVMGCAQLLPHFYLYPPSDMILSLATLIGLISGIIGLKSERKALAERGMALCIIGLLCIIVFVSS